MINLRLTGRQLGIKFDEEKQQGNPKAEGDGDKPGENNQQQPEQKPLTASVQDVLALYAQGSVEFVSQKLTLPPLFNGSNKFSLEDTKVLVRVKGDIPRGAELSGGTLKAEKLLNMLKLDGNLGGTQSSDSINGEFDEKISQGGTGDCWVLTGLLALNSTEVGKNLIKQAVTVNEDGSVTVKFQGLDVSYTISADEIEKHDTDNIKSDAYSNGDNDMLVFELAVNKLMADIRSGKVKLDVPADSYEGSTSDYGIDGGYSQMILYYMTGKTSDTRLPDAFNNARTNNEAWKALQDGLPESEVINILRNAYNDGNTVLTFGMYGNYHNAYDINGERYSLNLGNGGHALAITNLTATTVTFVNPWDSSKEYTMTYEEFAKLGIGMLTSTSLDGVQAEGPQNPTDPVIPDNPVTPPEPVIPNPIKPLYTEKVLHVKGFSAGNIEQYFDKTEDGKYKLKEGIKVSWYKGEIDSLETLEKILCTDERKLLRLQGLTDEIIDKYFHVEQDPMINSRYIYGEKPEITYSLKLNGDFSSHTVETRADGSKKMTIRSNDGNSFRTIIINPDGSYKDEGVTGRVMNGIQQPSGSKLIEPDKTYTFDDLKDIPQSVLSEYFVAGKGGFVLKEGTDIEKISIYYYSDGKTEIRILTPTDKNSYRVREMATYSQAYMDKKGWDSLTVNMFFEKEPRTGNYMLKDGITLKDVEKYHKNKGNLVINSDSPFVNMKRDVKFEKGTIYQKEDFGDLPESIINRYFKTTNGNTFVLDENKADSFVMTLKAVEISFKALKTSENENGETVSEEIESETYYKKEFFEKNVILDQTISKFFYLNYNTGKYVLKDDCSMEDVIKFNQGLIDQLKEEANSVIENDIDNNVKEDYNTFDKKETYTEKFLLEQGLSDAFIAEYFKPLESGQGKANNTFELADPWTDIEFEGRGPNQSVICRLTYEQDGMEYYRLVQIAQDGSYKVMMEDVK